MLKMMVVSGGQMWYTVKNRRYTVGEEETMDRQRSMEKMEEFYKKYRRIDSVVNSLTEDYYFYSNDLRGAIGRLLLPDLPEKPDRALYRGAGICREREGVH